MAFCTRSISRPLLLKSTAARLFDVMNVGGVGHEETPPRRVTETVSMPAIAFSRSFADGKRYTRSSAAPSP